MKNTAGTNCSGPTIMLPVFKRMGALTAVPGLAGSDGVQAMPAADKGSIVVGLDKGMASEADTGS